MKGFLITFEGGEGSGKSTQAKRFAEFLKEQKIDYIATKEPGGTIVGEEVRKILLHSKGEISPETEFLLFSACRSQIVKDVIKPALEAGKVVVLDRFFDSSFVYQGYAGDIALETIEQITNFVTDGIQPDLTILLDISYDDGMERKAKDEKLKNLDRMESKGAEYHNKIRKGFLKLAEKDKKRFYVIYANKEQDEIFEEIKEEFLRRYNKKA